MLKRPSSATSCPDLKLLFARGSGADRYDNEGYEFFKSTLEPKLKTAPITYEFDDIDYPAVSIDIGEGHLDTLVGAYLGGGSSYEFGDSVQIGVEKLARIVNENECQNTEYVFGGYSQGAVVVLNTLDRIDPEKVVYIATFGDPKVYFPEGAGLIPAACRGDNLSEYRIFAPDCYAHKGILGAREPYHIASFEGKVGTWCNKRDILCSSHYSIRDHTSYAEDGLYEDASRLIFSKIASEFNFKNEYTSPHDTAILIDSTGSMTSLVKQYKAEALRLAKKTLAIGGRVALFDYRDLGDGYTPVERCNFNTCSLDSFEMGLNSILTEGGGDDPESLLSASLHVMNSLDWKLGSTKSLVILTDSGYHSPDLDGTSFFDVKALSQKIDPVNFYIITTEGNRDLYQTLAEATDGVAATTLDDLGLLTDNIISRFDSLPRVEEDTNPVNLPKLSITSVEHISNSEIKVKFATDGIKTMVIINDTIMGITDQTELVITDLNPAKDNIISLVPLTDSLRGDPVTIDLGQGFGNSALQLSSDYLILPKAPNTGIPSR